MYSDKVEVLRFETEPYRKHLQQNGGTPDKNQNGLLYTTYTINNNNNNDDDDDDSSPKHVVYRNGYHNALVETETTKPPAAANVQFSKSNGCATDLLLLHHQSPLSVLHSRHNPRPGRLLLENVNNRPQTMDRGTQANTDDAVVAVQPPPLQSAGDVATGSELYRNANISMTSQKLMTNGGDNSSVDSLNSADSAKRDSEESVIELAEFHQPMISKDNIDGHINNGDGKVPSVGKSNGNVKEHPVDDEVERTSCGMECLYFAMQCCECSIM